MDLEAVASAARVALPRYFGPDAQPLMELWPAYHVYERVFLPEFAEPARDAYTKLWATAPVLPLPAPGTTPLVEVALAEDLAAAGPRSRAFPNGYRSIARQLQPGMAWLVLRFVQPGTTIGLMFDGFVHLGGESFAWFPKPWKTVARVAIEPSIFDE